MRLALCSLMAALLVQTVTAAEAPPPPEAYGRLPAIGSAAISPDGKRLAVTILEKGNWDLWLHSLERDSQTRLTSDESADAGSVWSPR